MRVFFLRARALSASIGAIAAMLVAMTLAPGPVAPVKAAANVVSSASPTPSPSPSPSPSQAQTATSATPNVAKKKTQRVQVAKKKRVRATKKRKRRKLTGKQKAGFVWPVSGPITSRFGRRVIFGRVEPHRGMDIACSKRQAIEASKAGRVIFVQRRNSIYGKIAVVRHHKGYSTLYAHMRRMRVDVGDRVRKGETIGKCGETGRATGPHLHFEIRRGSRHLNPRPYLNRR